MADHRAEQILAAVTSTLTGLTTTGSNVKRARVYDFGITVTDALTINMGSDKPVDIGNIQFNDHELEIFITAHTKNTSLDTRLNLIKKEVIAALMSDRTQGLAFVIDTIEQGWNQPELSEGETREGICQGSFVIMYRRAYTAADS